MCASLAGLAGCSKPVSTEQAVRTVRVYHVPAEAQEYFAEYPGEIRPRVESRLAFRVTGKIVSRDVDVGSVVKRGQVLMRLDPQDLQLAQAQANAGMMAAKTNFDLAKLELERYQELRDKNYVSQAVLDAKLSAFKAAQASYQQALAAYQGQSNQIDYTTLRADTDGVVTAIDSEVGQIATVGTPVLRLARSAERDVVIGVPEDKIDFIRHHPDVEVRLWARPAQRHAGIVREVSPVADPATRTYTVKVALSKAPADIGLGMTAYVRVAAAGESQATRIPLTALFHDKSGNAVWIVNNGTIQRANVMVEGIAGNDLLIRSGVQPGQAIVSAGVNLLRSGETVKVIDDGARASDARNQAEVSAIKLIAASHEIAPGAGK